MKYTNLLNNNHYRFLIIIFIIISMIISVIPVSSQEEIKLGSYLTFTVGTKTNVGMRYTQDGGSFTDSNFDRSFMSGSSYDGIGLMTDDHTLYVMFDDVDAIIYSRSFGIGQFSQRAKINLEADIDSAPSGVGIANGEFLIAYRSDDKVVVIYYDNSLTTDKRVISHDTAPSCLENSNVLGRPTISFKDGTYLLAWRVEGNKGIIASGSRINGVPTFNDCRELQFPEFTGSFDTYSSGIYSDLDITSDLENFYMVFIRLPSCLCEGHPAYRNSTDGINWSEDKEIYNFGALSTFSPIQITAIPNGTLLFAGIDREQGVSIIKQDEGITRYTKYFPFYDTWSTTLSKTAFGDSEAFSYDFDFITMFDMEAISGFESNNGDSDFDLWIPMFAIILIPMLKKKLAINYP